MTKTVRKTRRTTLREPLYVPSLGERLERATRSVVLASVALRRRDAADEPLHLFILESAATALVDAHEDLFWALQANGMGTPAPSDDDVDAAGGAR